MKITLYPHYKPQWKPNSLGSIICQFKSISTKRIRLIGFHNFAWQPRFHEHIIRNERELNQKREYIINNSLQWELDDENPDGIKKRCELALKERKEGKLVDAEEYLRKSINRYL